VPKPLTLDQVERAIADVVPQAAHQLDESLHDGESESGARVLAGGERVAL
jgi:hypothetical protein